jgi:hypothetical protein
MDGAGGAAGGTVAAGGASLGCSGGARHGVCGRLGSTGGSDDRARTYPGGRSHREDGRDRVGRSAEGRSRGTTNRYGACGANPGIIRPLEAWRLALGGMHPCCMRSSTRRFVEMLFGDICAAGRGHVRGGRRRRRHLRRTLWGNRRHRLHAYPNRASLTTPPQFPGGDRGGAELGCCCCGKLLNTAQPFRNTNSMKMLVRKFSKSFFLVNGLLALKQSIPRR